jgi:GNAT superfamily N-acetyltransferase
LNNLLFIDQDVARRLEFAQAWRSVCHAQAYQTLNPEAKVRIEPVGVGYAVFETLGSPLNRCTGLGFDGTVAETDIEFVEQFYQAHNTSAQIGLCPLADPSLLEILRKRNYRLAQFYTVLVRTLPETGAAVEIPPGILIRQVTPEFAQVWLETVAHGFSAPAEPDADLYAILAPNFYAANAIPFLAYMEGQPAGGGGMYTHESVVEFGGASTLPNFRRRGVQTALLQVRMQTARQAGCDLGMVMTSPGSHSQRNVERQGFQVAYSKAIMVLDNRE